MGNEGHPGIRRGVEGEEGKPGRRRPREGGQNGRAGPHPRRKPGGKLYRRRTPGALRAGRSHRPRRPGGGGNQPGAHRAECLRRGGPPLRPGPGRPGGHRHRQGRTLRGGEKAEGDGRGPTRGHHGPLLHPGPKPNPGAHPGATEEGGGLRQRLPPTPGRGPPGDHRRKGLPRHREGEGPFLPPQRRQPQPPRHREQTTPHPGRRPNGLFGLSPGAARPHPLLAGGPAHVQGQGGRHDHLGQDHPRLL